MKNVLSRAGLFLLLGGLFSVANADPIVYAASGTGVDGHLLSAQATFEIVGDNLVITLTNTGPNAVVPADVLTGIFFDVTGNPDLSASSAFLGEDSSVIYPPSGDGTQGGTGDVGGEWAYRDGISGPHSTEYGVSSSGLGIFGGANRFNTSSNLQGPSSGSPGGMEYGIVSGIGSGANAPLSGPNAFIDDTVVFTLSGWGDRSLADITNVWFQYGTALTEPSIKGEIVPEPATVLMIGFGLAGLAYRKKRKTA